MFNNKNKNAAFSLSLILLLATTLMMTFAQPSSAQFNVRQPEKTAGYASVAPTLLGVDQIATVNLWVFPLPTRYDMRTYFNGFYGVTATFVKPDGTKDTFMPVDGTGAYIPGEMSALGSMYFFYKPQMAGNWSVSFTMPAQNLTDKTGTVLMEACTSNTAYFTVQTEPVMAGLLNGYPWASLPNSNVYWSYPISANNREWSQISGDWTGVLNTHATVKNSGTEMRWQPYGAGPNTGHIVWKYPIESGGMIGGAYGSLSYYVPRPATTVIMDGKVFYNIPSYSLAATATTSTTTDRFVCIDEATGKVLYIANGLFEHGIHLPNLLGAYQQAASAVAANETEVLLESSYGSYKFSYLWGSNSFNGTTYWNYYDVFTGTLRYQYRNASSANLIDGTVLAFGAGNLPGETKPSVYRWNMTQVQSSGARANDWQTGITWKVPAPRALVDTPSSLAARIFGVTSDLSTVVVYNYNQYWAYNADTGASLWNLTVPYAVNNNEEVPLAIVDKFIVFDPVAATTHCYSMKTGTELWQTPSVADSPWATTWTIYFSETNDRDNLYMSFPDGSMRAYSLTDGHLIWTSKPFASTEYANNAVPFIYSGLVMVDGKIYGYAGYSTLYSIDPVPRFAMAVCVNATTGDIVFALNGAVNPSATANGYVIGKSIFDGQMYCIGKGPSSTTVLAQQQVGGSVLIQGSILDNSPVSSSADLNAMFPYGVPAISDADMSVWMDYLHMKNSTLLNNPPQCNGVPVTLTAIDPNGNSINIGSTTSDVTGHFAYQWSPTTAGLYKIYATFAGSNSYFSSNAETSATVASVVSPTAVPTSSSQTLTSNTDTYLGIGVIAIIIAIAIVGLVLYRKK